MKSEGSTNKPPAPGAVHEPADVGGQLLRLRTWQHHAVIQGMQETALRNPALSLDQVLVHERDLPGRPPEAEKAQAKPVEESLPEGGGRRGDVKRMFVHGKGTGGNGRGRRPRAAVAMLSLSGTHPVTDSRTGPTPPRPGGHVRSHRRRNHKGFLH